MTKSITGFAGRNTSSPDPRPPIYMLFVIGESEACQHGSSFRQISYLGEDHRHRETLQHSEKLTKAAACPSPFPYTLPSLSAPRS